MSIFNFFEEAERLEKPGQFVRERIVVGDGFDIDIYVYESGDENRLHTCSKDEYFYVLKGKTEMLVGHNRFTLNEGEGLMVNAGLKHKHTSAEKLWMMVISKWPHEHLYFE